MKLFRNALAAGLLAGATVIACSSHHGTNTATGKTNGNSVGSNPGNVGQEGTGSVGMHLTIGPGLNLYALNWTVTNGTNSYSGTVQIGDAQSIEFVAGGILAGSGYTVTLTGTDSAGDFCQGVSAAFSVAASATSFTGVLITCTQDTDATTAANVNTGSVHVDAGVNVVAQGARSCPGISSFSISPAEILATGQTAQLNVATIGPVPTSIQWTVSGGAGGGFSDPNAANPTFSCGGAGLVTVTVQVLENGTHPDGTDAGNVCNGVANTSFSGTINCEATGGCGTCFAPTTLQCGSCLDGGATSTCVNPNTDNNNCGGCGVVCAAGNTCNSGVCTAPPPTTCTVAPCAASGPNSVKCAGSPTLNGVCTPTEKLFVDKDIAAGRLTAGQPSGGTPATESCYACLNSKLCLDKGTTTTGQECGDVPTTAQNGPTGCLAVLSCTITAKCATSNPDSQCFCGTAVGSACNTPGAANGPCLNQEATAIGFPASDGVDVTLNYTDTTRAGGMANTIFSCAFSNGCAHCLD